MSHFEYIDQFIISVNNAFQKTENANYYQTNLPGSPIENKKKDIKKKCRQPKLLLSVALFVVIVVAISIAIPLLLNKGQNKEDDSTTVIPPTTVSPASKSMLSF
jgi:hypothetical protein